MTCTAQIRCLLLVLLVALTLCGVPAAADDGGWRNGPKDNKAVAEPRGAGSSDFDLAFSVRRTANDAVDETNTALAYANCQACRGIAVAFQIVIVQGSPGTVKPQNVAVAVNDRCPGCSVLAVAHQFVVGRGEPLEFTERGHDRLEKIRDRLEDLEDDYDELTNDQIRARTDASAVKIRDILARDLVAARSRGDDDDDETRGPPIGRESSDDDDG